MLPKGSFLLTMSCSCCCFRRRSSELSFRGPVLAAAEGSEGSDAVAAKGLEGCDAMMKKQELPRCEAESSQNGYESKAERAPKSVVVA